jgi:RNA polymerase sigma-B factor
VEPVAPATRRADDQALFRRYRRDRDPALRDALVERFMPLSRHLARRYRTGGEHEDVAQVAALALLKAIDRYDPDQGSAFTSFATPTIIGEIKRYFRDHGWAVHMPRALQELAVRVERVTPELTARHGRAPTPGELAEALDVTVERVLEALDTSTAHYPVALDRPLADGDGEGERPWRLLASDEPGFSAVEDAFVVDSLLDRLPERDRIVVELRFRDDLLQREIGDLLGISQMHVSRILAHAMATLREATAA